MSLGLEKVNGASTDFPTLLSLNFSAQLFEFSWPDFWIRYLLRKSLEWMKMTQVPFVQPFPLPWSFPGSTRPSRWPTFHGQQPHQKPLPLRIAKRLSWLPTWSSGCWNRSRSRHLPAPNISRADLPLYGWCTALICRRASGFWPKCPIVDRSDPHWQPENKDRVIWFSQILDLFLILWIFSWI